MSSCQSSYLSCPGSLSTYLSMPVPSAFHSSPTHTPCPRHRRSQKLPLSTKAYMLSLGKSR
ncbi:hypothetical protein BJX66DRAFT_307482 [Aspergillus keveii]|uniref:Uncharacterized protein n=1 Tax=Aspergillus keveii TaxID=714993 RepID=A0ABR4G0R0_9EURO